MIRVAMTSELSLTVDWQYKMYQLVKYLALSLGAFLEKKGLNQEGFVNLAP